MNTYLLDTNIFLAAMKGESSVRHRLEELPESSLLLSPIVLGELFVGVEKSQHCRRNREKLERIVSGLVVVPISNEVSEATV